MKMQLRTRQGLVVLLGLMLLPTLMVAQQFVLSTADRARLIALDFTAVGPDGSPVTDLTAQDITLKVDGQTRAIRHMEFVPTATTGRRVPSPFGTNQISSDSRAFVFVIDDETLKPGREQALRDDVRAFLSQIGEQDRVALVTVPYGGIKTDFTFDKGKVIAALNNITGRAPQNESGDDAGRRSRSTLVALGGTIESLARSEAPVSVVYFGQRLNAPRGVTSLSRTNVDGIDYMNAMGNNEVLVEHYEQVSTAVAKARAQLYIVLPDLSADNSGREGLEHLAGVTGAPIWNLRNGDSSALTRLSTETAGYYLARIEPSPGEAPDVVRGYNVSTSRPGVTIRQRPRMQVRPPTPTGPAPKPGAPLDMMRESRLFSDLPLRVTAASSRNADGSVKVVALFDAPGSAGLSSGMVGLFDGAGRMVASSSLTTAELTGSPMVAALTAAPGDYRLRVAAVETGGRAGAADVDLNVGLADAGPMKLSSLILGVTREKGFQPRLEFTSEITATAVLEIYGAQAGTPVGAAFEIATTMNGPAMATVPGAFSPTNEPDKFIVTAAIPVGALKPGDYAIRAIVAQQGQPGGRVIRILRKSAPPATK